MSDMDHSIPNAARIKSTLDCCTTYFDRAIALYNPAKHCPLGGL